jgi:hypothetical protein
MIGWHFARLADGWEWFRITKAGELGASSARAFTSVSECLDDATKNGYSFSVPAGDGVPNRAVGD